MAFSPPVPKTADEYNALQKSFREPPMQDPPLGTPDTRVTVLLGGWVSDTVMAFMVTNMYGTSSIVSVDPLNANTINFNVVDREGPLRTYYTIDVGAADNRNQIWIINLQTQANGTYKGTWVFKKGGFVDEKY